jgi:hypothetical protein
LGETADHSFKTAANERACTSQPNLKIWVLFSLAVPSGLYRQVFRLKGSKDTLQLHRRTGQNEIFEPGKKGTLDGETKRMSPGTLRSLMKLYQSVENSVNEIADPYLTKSSIASAGALFFLPFAPANNSHSRESRR